jgi:hypothetical protein
MDDDTPPSSDDAFVPLWHAEVLAERVKALQDGRTEFVDWEEAKERLRHRIRIVPDSE